MYDYFNDAALMDAAFYTQSERYDEILNGLAAHFEILYDEDGLGEFVYGLLDETIKQAVMEDLPIMGVKDLDAVEFLLERQFDNVKQVGEVLLASNDGEDFTDEDWQETVDAMITAVASSLVDAIHPPLGLDAAQRIMPQP